MQNWCESIREKQFLNNTIKIYNAQSIRKEHSVFSSGAKNTCCLFESESKIERKEKAVKEKKGWNKLKRTANRNAEGHGTEGELWLKLNKCLMCLTLIYLIYFIILLLFSVLLIDWWFSVIGWCLLLSYWLADCKLVPFLYNPS